MNHAPEVQLNLNVRGLKPSATLAINEHSNQLKQQGRRVFKLGLGQSRRILGALGRHCAKRLQETGAASSLPDGAFYLFPDPSPLRESLAQRGITTATALAESLLEDTGVAVLPGVDFGRPAEELTVRLAYVDFDGARVLAAAEHLPRGSSLNGEFLEQYCERTVIAIDRFSAWLNES